MAQLVKRPSPDFGSDQDLMTGEISPHAGLCADSVEPAGDSLSLSASLLVCVHVLSLSK